MAQQPLTKMLAQLKVKRKVPILVIMLIKPFGSDQIMANTMTNQI